MERMKVMSDNTIVYQCPNGLTVLIHPKRGSELVSVRINVKTGSINEGCNVGSGLSHMLEHMVFKGTEEFSCEQLSARVKELGGNINAGTYYDYTNFYIDGIAKNWSEYFHILAQLTFHPTFPEEEFERERDVIRREMSMYNDDVDFIFWDRVFEKIFNASPYKYPIIGKREMFDRLTRADMIEYYKDRYVPCNMFVTIVGGIDPEEVKRVINEEVKTIEAKPLICKSPINKEAPQMGYCRYFEDESDKTLSSKVGMFWRFPNYNHPDARILECITNIIGVGGSSPLYNEFFNKRKLVYNICATFVTFENEDSLFSVIFECDPKNREKIIGDIEEFICYANCCALGHTKAKNSIKMNVVRRKSTVSGYANLLERVYNKYGYVGFLQEYLEEVSNFDFSDFEYTFDKYISRPSVVYCLNPVGTEKMSQTDTIKSSEIKNNKDSSVQTTCLDNGLKIVTKKQPIDDNSGDYSLVGLQMCFKAGCQYETASNAGISKMISHMVIKPEEYTKVETLGGTIESLQINTLLCINALVFRKSLDEVIRIFGNIISEDRINSEQNKDRFESFKSRVINERKEESKIPVNFTLERLRSLIFGNTSYGKSYKGTIESLSNISFKDVVNYSRHIITPNNCTIAIVGENINQDDIVNKICERLELNKMYNNVTLDSDGSNITISQSVWNDEASRTMHEVEMDDVEQSIVAVMMKAPDGHDKRYVCGSILNKVINDISGSFFTEVREKKGLAYYVCGFHFTGSDIGWETIYSAVTRDTADETQKTLEELLNRYVEQGMSEYEFEKSKEQVIIDCMCDSERVISVADSIASETALDFALAPECNVIEAIKSITLEDMNNYIREVFGGKRVWMITRSKV